MQRDIVRQIRSTWAGDNPIALDAVSVPDLRSILSKLRTKWMRRFNDLSKSLAAYFAKASAERVDATLRAALKRSGFAVEFKMTQAQQEAISATTTANVALIKSIPAQHLTDVEGAVMRSVQTGRDIGALAKQLRETYGVTKRRAAFISQDQNAKATATITRVRQQELGIVQAKWLHSAGGKTPRPSHVANSGNPYDVAKGWFDPDAKEWIRPGELPGCRCVSVSIVPGFG